MSKPVLTCLIRFGALSTLGLAFVGCSVNSTPSETVAKKAYGNFLSQRRECADKLTLTDFKKTNGRKSGEGTYEVFFDAEVSVVKNIDTSAYSCTGVNIDRDYNGTLKRTAGTKNQLSGVMQFAKTEKGWMLNRIHIGEW